MTTDIEVAPTVVRTERGLSIVGTRITVYDVMDYLVAGWPPHLIYHRLHVHPGQIEAVMAYIAAHQTEVEQEYAAVVAEAQQNRQYWETRNQERLAQIAMLPAPAGQEAVREKLRAWHARSGVRI